MLIRLWLDPIANKESFKQMLLSSTELTDIPKDLRITEEEYQCWHKQILNISLPIDVFNDLYELKNLFQTISEKQDDYESTQSIDAKQKLRTLGSNASLYISDRRWKKAFRLLCSSAFYNGRTNIEKIDLLLLKDCLWHNLHTREHINK